MANRWSHAHGKTSREVVPFTWQPTLLRRRPVSGGPVILHSLRFLDVLTLRARDELMSFLVLWALRLCYGGFG